MTEREELAWDMYFCSVMGMALHPGTSRENAVKRSPSDCADIADEMIRERRKRMAKNVQDRKAA